MLTDSLVAQLPELRDVPQIESAPISAVHLWFDRAICDFPHAVLPGRVSQWLFSRGMQQISGDAGNESVLAHYYQVVISASRECDRRPRKELVSEVVRELTSVWQLAGEANLLRARVITDQHAVFSVRPGLERWRPSQKSSVPNLYFAGDWTATSWPATMEGAVRSGYLAAEHVLSSLEKPAQLVAPDLPRAWLVRLLFGS